MIRLLALPLFLITLIIAACSPFDETAPRTLSGTLSVGEPVQVPDGTLAIVELLPASEDSEAAAQASLTLNEADLPLEFSLEVDPARLAEDESYVVRAALVMEGELRWLSPPVAVEVRRLRIEAGEVRLDPVLATPADSGSETAPASPEEALFLCGDIPVIVTRNADGANLSVGERTIALGPAQPGDEAGVLRYESADGESWFEDAGATARYQVEGETGPDCIRLF
ncbi:MAG: YbaY family lipoprotein [Glycocaulis sp.]